MANIILRNDTAAAWAAINPVLLDGEPGWDETNYNLKIGNGSTPWNALPFQLVNKNALPSHTHTLANVTGLNAALNEKATIVSLNNGLGTKAGTEHTHQISDVTGLQTELNTALSTKPIVTIFTPGLITNNQVLYFFKNMYQKEIYLSRLMASVENWQSNDVKIGIYVNAVEVGYFLFSPGFESGCVLFFNTPTLHTVNNAQTIEKITIPNGGHLSFRAPASPSLTVFKNLEIHFDLEI